MNSITATSTAFTSEHCIENRRKEEAEENIEPDDITISRQSLFGRLPDEMVVTILFYGEMEDIQSTRVWQSKLVKRCTKTRSNWKDSINNHLDNLKWIYDFIGDTNFTKKIERGPCIQLHSIQQVNLLQVSL